LREEQIFEIFENEEDYNDCFAKSLNINYRNFDWDDWNYYKDLLNEVELENTTDLYGEIVIYDSLKCNETVFFCYSTVRQFYSRNASTQQT